jgi:polar amino acid transport system permease protein
MSVFLSWIAILAAGLWVTVQLSFFAVLATVILSSVIAMASIMPWRPLRVAAQIYVDVVRSTPLLALLMFLYFALGPLVGRFGVSAFWLAVLGLTLSESSYLAEVYRGGLLAIPTAQWEAGESLGLRWGQVIRRVIVPQALPPGVPGTVNFMIATIKDSSLASLITVNEVTLVATSLVSATFKPFQVYLVLGLMYLALITPFALASRGLEGWIARRFGLQARVTLGRVDQLEMDALARRATR